MPLSVPRGLGSPLRFLVLFVALLVGSTALQAMTASAGAASGLPAVGTIVTVPGADVVDGEVFLIGDGASSPTVFEFDSNGSVVPGNARVAFGATDTAGQVPTSVVNAVTAAPLAMAASAAGFAVVSLVSDATGPAANVPMIETVSAPAFTVLGMSGGTNDGTAAAQATGTIVTVPGADLADGETFTMSDGAGPPSIFEFDRNGSVTSGNVLVTFQPSDTAAQVKASVASAVNPLSAFGVTASS